MSTDNNKDELRRRLRAQRLALAPEDQRRAAQQLAAQVIHTRAFRVSRRVAFYLAHHGEIDPAPILEHAQHLGKTCYLPVLSHLSWDRLWFAPAKPGVEFKRNRFGIPEPQVPARELVRAPALDLILLPLVGFDPAGHRLGMGGGFYDKSLAFLRHRQRWHKPHLIGLAYEFQRLAQLPTNVWDVPLTAVVTDQAVYDTE